ncbi:MAG TPA: alr0857 family protein, partial [Stenomitos sp.]
GVTLERSVESLEAVVRRRVLLGLRMGEPVGLEPTSVSVLVNQSLPDLKGLMTAILNTPTNALELIQKGAAQVEMRLQGYWLSPQSAAGEGIFFISLDPHLEGHFVKIWQSSHQDASCYS